MANAKDSEYLMRLNVTVVFNIEVSIINRKKKERGEYPLLT